MGSAAEGGDAAVGGWDDRGASASENNLVKYKQAFIEEMAEEIGEIERMKEEDEVRIVKMLPSCLESGGEFRLYLLGAHVAEYPPEVFEGLLVKRDRVADDYVLYSVESGEALAGIVYMTD